MIGVRRLKPNNYNLDLLDLLNERHEFLRRVIEERWSEISDRSFSSTEWYIMSRIYKKQTTISYVTKHVDITRQATHKIIKKLESKGIVEVTNLDNNKRDKGIQLTNLGELCYENNLKMKEEIEKNIAEVIGNDQIKTLKKILQLDWGL